MSAIRRGWKTILVLAVVSIASYSIGTYANQVKVQDVQSLAGNHVLVPAPELQILSTTWIISLNTSQVVGLTLNVTTFTTQPTAPMKLYQIIVQVSCLDAAGKEFTCSVGTASITLPTNMTSTGASALLRVKLLTPVDPERIEVHDLSFIVTGTPVRVPTTALPNLFFPNCLLPPSVNVLTTCLGTRQGFIDIVVGNNGPVAAGPFTVAFTGALTDSISLLGLGPGASVTVSESFTACTFTPDCNFKVTIDPTNAVAESSEADNTILATILG